MNYDYKCKGCNLLLTEDRRFGDNSPPPCPSCEHVMTQVIEPCQFILKGSGWTKPSHYSRDWTMSKSASARWKKQGQANGQVALDD